MIFYLTCYGTLSLHMGAQHIYFFCLSCIQLIRRVREMREARTAPSVQELDQKAAAAVAAARKALTSVQTLPKGVEVLDPLGLG
jgi:hypothetical protein